MSKEIVEINGIRCLLYTDLVKVKHSYCISYDEVSRFCDRLKAVTGTRYKRSAKSWEHEVVAHNMLFHVGLFESHVIDTDLDDHESIHRRTCYVLLYMLHKIKERFQDE